MLTPLLLYPFVMRSLAQPINCLVRRDRKKRNIFQTEAFFSVLTTHRDQMLLSTTFPLFTLSLSLPLPLRSFFRSLTLYLCVLCSICSDACDEFAHNKFHLNFFPVIFSPVVPLGSSTQSAHREWWWAVVCVCVDGGNVHHAQSVQCATLCILWIDMSLRVRQWEYGRE